MRVSVITIGADALETIWRQQKYVQEQIRHGNLIHWELLKSLIF